MSGRKLLDLLSGYTGDSPARMRERLAAISAFAREQVKLDAELRSRLQEAEKKS